MGMAVEDDGRIPRRVLFPSAARPDCAGCDKPEILPSNVQVVAVYSLLQRDLKRSEMSGHYLGLRFEAVTEAIRWGQEAGWVDDPDLVMRRIWVLADVDCAVRNAKIDAQKPPK